MNPGPFLLLPKFLFYAIIHNKSIRISEVETEMDEQGGLFERTAYQPLAERVRPQSLEEFVGQEHLLGSGKVLRRLIESDHITSMIFWGPPGVGKTTLAQIIAAQTKAKFITFSAVTSGIKDIRTVMQEADRRRIYGDRIIVFVDEIHRFNKAQQDAFLPFVEKGSIVLIGATTENPSFEINSALLSRCRVFVLQGLTIDDIKRLLQHALSSDRELRALRIHLSDEGIAAISAFANGDARSALSTLEMLILNADERDGEIYVTEENLAQCISRKSLLYDKSGEEHFNLISALHKSMRGSDPDAALYWLARMLVGGEDPRYVARRLVRFASEDVGMADPSALQTALAAWEAYERLGSPEGELAIAQAVVHLATAPKSVALYRGLGRAREAARRTGSLAPPAHILNAPTRLMKELGYGEGYEYDPDVADGFSGADYFPDGYPPRSAREPFYTPTANGYERRIRERLDHWEDLRRRRSGEEQ